jgi:hypothetical protein
LLSNGTKDIFSFKVTVPESDNIDYDSDPLGVKLGTTTFTVATSAGVTLTGFKVERVGGASGELTADYAGSTTSMGDGTFAIAFQESFGTSEDLIVEPGETAEYVIRATVGGVESNDSLQVSIEDLQASTPNFSYTHNVGSDGSYTSQTSEVYTKLPGVTYVRGGSLTN